MQWDSLLGINVGGTDIGLRGLTHNISHDFTNSVDSSIVWRVVRVIAYVLVASCAATVMGDGEV